MVSEIKTSIKDGIEFLQINSWLCDKMIFVNGNKTTHRKRVLLSTNSVGKLDVHMENNEVESSSYTVQKVQLEKDYRL